MEMDVRWNGDGRQDGGILEAIWRLILGYIQAGKLATYLATFKQASWPHTWPHFGADFDECIEDCAVWPSAASVLFECCLGAETVQARRKARSR